MTIRQIVLFSFPDGPDEKFLTRLSAGLADLVAAIPDIADASWGPGLGENPEHYHYALVQDFADLEALARYKKHPAHLRFIQDYMRELAMHKVRIQYELPAECGASRDRL